MLHYHNGNSLSRRQAERARQLQQSKATGIGVPAEILLCMSAKPPQDSRKRQTDQDNLQDVCGQEISGDAAGLRAVVNKDIGKRTRHRGPSNPAAIIESQCGFINQQRL
jgi:hypothetical protein